jgi:chromosome segregation ATPase
MAWLENQKVYLQLEVDATRSLARNRTAELESLKTKLEERNAQILSMNTKLAEKNVTIKEKNKTILDLEQASRLLQMELKEDKRMNRAGDVSSMPHQSMQNRTPTGQSATEPTGQNRHDTGSRLMEPTIGQMAIDQRGTGTVAGGKSHKKRKLVEFVHANEDIHGDKHNPWVID